MQKLRSRMLQKDVGLTADQTAKVEKTLKRFAPERRKLRAELHKHRDRLRSLLTQDSNDQKAYARHIKGMREAQKKLRALRERQIDELQKQLTPKQQAKLGVAARRMRGRLRGAVRRHRHRRGRRGR